MKDWQILLTALYKMDHKDLPPTDQQIKDSLNYYRSLCFLLHKQSKVLLYIYLFPTAIFLYSFHFICRCWIAIGEKLWIMKRKLPGLMCGLKIFCHMILACHKSFMSPTTWLSSAIHTMARFFFLTVGAWLLMEYICFNSFSAIKYRQNYKFCVDS